MGSVEVKRREKADGTRVLRPVLQLQQAAVPNTEDSTHPRV